MGAVSHDRCARCGNPDWEIVVRDRKLCAWCYAKTVQDILREERLGEQELLVELARRKRFIKWRHAQPGYIPREKED